MSKQIRLHYNPHFWALPLQFAYLWEGTYNISFLCFTVSINIK